MMKKFSTLLLSLLTFGLVQAQTLNVTVTPTNPTTCNGTGSASVAVSGCAGPYTYTVDGGAPQIAQTSPFTIPNLAAGPHTVNVTTAGSSGPVFQDNFENGTSNWTLNNSSGTNSTDPNSWVINSASPYNGSCATGAGNNSLHVTCLGFICGLLYPTQPAVYNESGAANATDRFTSTVDINTVGRTNLQLKFTWSCQGDPGDDFGSVRYSINGGSSWVDLSTEYSGGGSSWSCATINLPATCENITNLRLGFRWRNSGDGVGTDPSFNIDNVVLDGAGGGSGGCAGSATFNITGGSGTFTPTTNVTGVQSICPGETLTITATTGQNCTWNTTPSQSGQSIVVSAAGSYACTCQDQTGTCSGTSSPVNVTLAPPPVGGFSYSQIDNYTIEFTSTSTGGTQFDWIFPNAPTTGSGATIQHDFPSEGNYTVTLIVSSDCGSDTIEQNIVVLKVGIDESSVFSKFDIYPNPAQGQTMLQLGSIKPFEGAIKIINPMGQIISDEVAKFSNTYVKTIDTGKFANGVYSIVVINEDGVFSRRLVINN